MNGSSAAPMFAPDALWQLLAGFDDESMTHLVGLFSDITIMSLLALSAYLMLLVGRISFCQQAFFGLGAYAAGVMTVMFHAPLAVALGAGVAVGALYKFELREAAGGEVVEAVLEQREPQTIRRATILAIGSCRQRTS